MPGERPWVLNHSIYRTHRVYLLVSELSDSCLLPAADDGFGSAAPDGEDYQHGRDGDVGFDDQMGGDGDAGEGAEAPGIAAEVPGESAPADDAHEPDHAERPRSSRACRMPQAPGLQQWPAWQPRTGQAWSRFDAIPLSEENLQGCAKLIEDVCKAWPLWAVPANTECLSCRMCDRGRRRERQRSRRRSPGHASASAPPITPWRTPAPTFAEVATPLTAVPASGWQEHYDDAAEPGTLSGTA